MPEVIVPDNDALIVSTLDFNEPAQVNRSEWTAGRKVVGLPGGSYWFGQVSVDDIATELEERPWRAFIAQLRGVQNWFKAPLPCQSHIGPAPLVGAGAGDGYTLPLSGMAADTRILYAGQHMTVPLPSGHFRAVRLTADLITDGAGNAVAEFAPALNEVPILGEPVETANPFVPVASTEPRLSIPIVDGVSSLSFEVEESR